MASCGRGCMRRRRRARPRGRRSRPGACPAAQRPGRGRRRPGRRRRRRRCRTGPVDVGRVGVQGAQRQRRGASARRRRTIGSRSAGPSGDQDVARQGAQGRTTDGTGLCWCVMCRPFAQSADQDGCAACCRHEPPCGRWRVREVPSDSPVADAHGRCHHGRVDDGTYTLARAAGPVACRRRSSRPACGSPPRARGLLSGTDAPASASGKRREARRALPDLPRRSPRPARGIIDAPWPDWLPQSDTGVTPLGPHATVTALKEACEPWTAVSSSPSPPPPDRPDRRLAAPAAQGHLLNLRGRRPG